MRMMQAGNEIFLWARHMLDDFVVNTLHLRKPERRSVRETVSMLLRFEGLDCFLPLTSDPSTSWDAMAKYATNIHHVVAGCSSTPAPEPTPAPAQAAPAQAAPAQAAPTPPTPAPRPAPRPKPRPQPVPGLGPTPAQPAQEPESEPAPAS